MLLSFFQVVQEYERAVIFRLGRLLQGGSRGPGQFIDIYETLALYIDGSHAVAV